MTVRNISAEEFETLVPEARWLVASFTRQGCPWCARIWEPLVHLQGIIGAKATVVRLDRAEAPEVFERFAVKSVPVCLLFKNGALKEIATGGGDDTLKWIESLEELAEA